MNQEGQLPQNPDQETENTPTESSSPEVTQPSQAQVFNTKKKSPKKPILILLLLIVLGIGGFFGFKALTKKDTPVNQTTPQTTTDEPAAYAPPTNDLNPNILLAYVSNDSPKELRISDSQQKTLAILKLPTGKDTFGVLANNGQAIMVEVSQGSTGSDKAPIDYIISRDGKVTQLPASVVTALNAAFPAPSESTAPVDTDISEGYLTKATDYIYTYVACIKSAKTCTLRAINLTTGANTAVLTNPFTPPAIASGYNSLVMLGASSDGVAYVAVYSATAQGKGTVKAVNVTTKATVKSMPMAQENGNMPTMSPDQKYVTYDAGDQIALMDTSTGQTALIKPTTKHNGSIFIWSPDSKKAAFVAESGADKLPEEKPPVAYLDVDTKKTVILPTENDDSRIFRWLYPNLLTLARPNSQVVYVDVISGQSYTNLLPKNETLL